MKAPKSELVKRIERADPALLRRMLAQLQDKRSATFTFAFEGRTYTATVMQSVTLPGGAA